MTRTTRWASIDAYIAAALPERRALLEEVRATIRAAAPMAEETISYNMPAFAQNGTLVYFASMKNHIGFYPTSSGIAAFPSEVSQYASTKGALRFPLDQPLPLDLIQRIVRFRVEENQRRATEAAATTPRQVHRSAEQHPTQGHAPAPLTATPLPPGLAAPATRALAAAGYTNLQQLAGVPVAELRTLHGMGPTALARLQEALAEEGLSLRIDTASHTIGTHHQRDDERTEDASDNQHAPHDVHLRRRRR